MSIVFRLIQELKPTSSTQTHPLNTPPSMVRRADEAKNSAMSLQSWNAPPLDGLTSCAHGDSGHFITATERILFDLFHVVWVNLDCDDVAPC